MMRTTLIIVSSILIFLGIVFYFITNKKRKRKRELKMKIMADGENDYSKTAKNIAMSISKSKELYKILITKVHPDRFHDEKRDKATELSARITKAKKNYNQLLLLQDEVTEFLSQFS
jgi:hypothetical protein